jgi:hypothetical protein
LIDFEPLTDVRNALKRTRNWLGGCVFDIVDPGLIKDGEDEGVGGQQINDSIKSLKERRTFLNKK